MVNTAEADSRSSCREVHRASMSRIIRGTNVLAAALLDLA